MTRHPIKRVPQETMIRQWTMLRMIPREPARRSTAKIVELLQDEVPSVDKRTVQRDLEKLSTLFGYTCDPEGRAKHWYFLRESDGIELPSMGPAAALALLMARDHTGNMMPSSVLDLLEPYFKRAESILSDAGNAPARWRKRVLVVDRGPTLLSPKISEEVQRAVSRALLDGKQLLASYRKRGAAQAKATTLHPQGLVLREGVLYIVAMAWDYADPYHYALHRFTRVEVSSEPARQPRDFDLSAYVEQAFHYPRQPKSIRLRLKMDVDAAYHLDERPLSSDQKIKLDGEHALITAGVADTEELRWWILGFGDKVEVLAPVRLRREIAATAEGMASKYSA